nr:hypothetical protein [Halomonas elongata]
MAGLLGVLGVLPHQLFHARRRLLQGSGLLLGSPTTWPPCSAVREASAASWLACWAFSAFCPTVEDSSSMLDAVSSREAACCSVRDERSLLPLAMLWVPW